MKRHRWTGRVVVLALAVSLAGILLPAPAHAANVTSAFDLKLDGYVQTNVMWDSSENTGDNPSSMRKIAHVKGSIQDGQETLRWAATRTRIWMDARGPDLWGAKSRGYFEFDWDGLKLGETSGTVSSTAANTPRLRRAYMRFDWSTFYILIGQDTLIFDGVVSGGAELEGVASGHGDITAGSRNRTPEVNIGASIPMMGAKLDLVGSVARHATDRQTDAGLNDSGARSAVPALEALVKATVPIFGRNAVFGASNYWGEEELRSGTTKATLLTKNVHSTGYALEALLPLGPAIPGIGAFDIRGNWFTAKNMASWNLGLNSLTTTTVSATSTPKEISSSGGWGEVDWAVNKNLAFGGGGGRVEDDKGDLLKIVSATTTATTVWKNQGWWLFGTWTDGPFLLQILYGKVDTTRIATATSATTKTHDDEVAFIFRYTF